MRAEYWDRVIAVNLTGAFNPIQAVLPHMRGRHHVAGGESVEHFEKFAPVATLARHLLAENPGASRAA